MGKAREVSSSDAVAPSAAEPVRPASAQVAWSDWQPLAGIPALSSDLLAEIVDGGQAFRWNRQTDGTWLGQWDTNVVQLRLSRNERIEWSAPTTLVASTPTALDRYFATDCDFTALADTLPWRSDPHLTKCIVAFSGLRILRQPFGETLLGFLCSATKQIVQIKQMLALLAERHGRPISIDASDASSGSPRRQTPVVQLKTSRSGAKTKFFRLPTWAELALIPETDLRACLLGFRARYIAETARFIAANPGWLAETETLPYPVAKARLCSLPGVGEKVADCVLLFGAGRLEAFPVDVWILKTLARRYGLDTWRTPQLVQFGRVHFGPLAGLAQQFLFAWERAQRRTEARRQDSAVEKLLVRADGR